MTCGAAIATAGDADRLLDESAAVSSITCLRLHRESISRGVSQHQSMGRGSKDRRRWLLLSSQHERRAL